MGVGVIVVLTALALIGALSWLTYAGLLGGALIYSIYGLGGMHTLYHIDENEMRKMRIFRHTGVWRLYVWLRDYHLIHHFVNKNFAIVLPVFDILGGSYESPTLLLALKANGNLKENLFPDFNPKLSSSCGQSLF